MENVKICLPSKVDANSIVSPKIKPKGRLIAKELPTSSRHRIITYITTQANETPSDENDGFCE
jgi:hypothetical protein